MNTANCCLQAACARGAAVIVLLVATAATCGIARADGASERVAKEAAAASLRRALRTATVLLAARAAQAMSGTTPPGKLPMTVFVGPVMAGAMNASGTATGEKQSDAAGVAFYVSQASALHGIIADFAGAAILGEDGDTVFTVRAASRRRGRGAPTTPTEDAEREMARKAGADYLIEASLHAVAGEVRGKDGGKEGGAGGSNGNNGPGESEVHLALQLVDAREGTVVCASDTALPEVSTVTKDSTVDRKKG